jgi:metal-responsive CopG/Arc/MetJ family transcriptional regulator
MPGKREQITIKVPKVLLERLNMEADRSGRKRSDIILQAISELMDRVERDRGSEPKPKREVEPKETRPPAEEA